MGRARRTNLTSQIFRFFDSPAAHILQVLDDAPPGFDRQTVAWQESGSLLQVWCSLVEKFQLFEIAIAPDADQEMQPHL